MRSHEAAGRRELPAGSHNESSGTVHGPVVQAGTVYGGIHLRTEAPPTAAWAPGAPWQLPPAVRLTGRTAELGALEEHRAAEAAEGRPAVAVLTGLGGIGKTATALTWLYRLRPRAPGGGLYADLGAHSPDGPADPAGVLDRFLRALGVPPPEIPAGLAERAALYRSLTTDRPVVALLDDAATAAQVRPLLPGGPSVTAVTGRRRLPGLSLDGGHPLPLEPLGQAAGVELLADTLADGRVAAQPEAARALVGLCAGLPLAVRLAGARLAARPARPLTTMVHALAEAQDRLDALAITGDRSVRAPLDLSYEGLPPAAARLYRRLGLHPGPDFGTEVATAVLAAPDGTPVTDDASGAASGTVPTSASDAALAPELLDVLHTASLLTDTTWTPVDRTVADPLPGPEADADAGTGTGAQTGTGTGRETAAGAGRPAPAPRPAQERYRFHDLVRLHAAAKAEEDEPQAERAAALRRIADHYLATATRAEELIDPQHRTLARTYGPGPVVGADPGAGAEQALDWLERELPNLMAVLRRARPAGFPTVAWQLADALWPLFLRRKLHEQGGDAHAEGLAAARESGDVVAECRMLTSGGLGELGRGGHARALEMFERAADAFRLSGDALGHARTLNYRGLAASRLGRLDQAADLYTRAAAELPACGDLRAGALARLNLADLALLTGAPDRSLAYAQAAHATLTEEGDPYNAARAATLWGRALLGQGLPEAAEARLSGALTTLRAMSADYETARCLSALALVALRRDRPGLARARFQEALDHFTAAGRADTPEAAAARDGLAGIAGPPEETRGP